MRILSLTLVLLFLFGCSKDEDTYKIYLSNTDSACEQLEEASEATLRMGRKLLLKSPWTLSLKEYL